MKENTPLAVSFTSSRKGTFLRSLKRLFYGNLSACMIAAVAVSLNSCGSGLGTGDSGAETRGPADASAFAGSVVSFNPTLSFFSNGVIEYSNESGSPFFGTLFPETFSGSPETGTYTYLPGPEYQTGTMTLTLPNINYVVAIPVTEFVTVDGFVQSFKLNFPVEGSFEATVESGSIPAASSSDGGGGGSGNDDSFVFDSDGKLVAGTRFTKTFMSNSSTILVDSSFPTPFKPRIPGETQEFVIGSDGAFRVPAVYPYSQIPYVISVPFLQASDNGALLLYQGFDTIANGTITITMEAKSDGLLGITWEEDLLTGGAYDFDRQTWK